MRPTSIMRRSALWPGCSLARFFCAGTERCSVRNPIPTPTPTPTPTPIPTPIPILTLVLAFWCFPYPIAGRLLENPHVRICADKSKKHRHNLHQHRLVSLNFTRTDEAFSYHHVKTC